ncbi:MAG: hypothetical protein ACHBNF_08655 [Chromatiales bacterium]
MTNLTRSLTVILALASGLAGMAMGARSAHAADQKVIPGTACRGTFPFYEEKWIFYGVYPLADFVQVSCPLNKDSILAPMNYVRIRIDAGGPGTCSVVSASALGGADDQKHKNFKAGVQTVVFSGAGLPQHYANGYYGVRCGLPAGSFFYGIQYEEQ